MYITTMSAFADETWYFGMCENQYAQPDVRISITPFSAFADFEVYAASSPNFADRVVCVIGDVPKELVEALK